MWLSLAFVSAALLGVYDLTKKQALRDNDVPKVLWLNTLFSTLLFLPSLLDAQLGLGWFAEGGIYTSAVGDIRAHLLVMVKAVIVLSSWLLGYYGLKHLPLTIVGPINATRPVLVLLGAMLLFGERLNPEQWVGVLLSFVSVFLLSRASRKEGINFAHNRWILLVALSAVMGAVSGLYDRFIMHSLNPIFVQSWYNLYQLLLMSLICLALWQRGDGTARAFRWSWAIPLISIFLSLADVAYLKALSDPEAMISVVSIARRSSVVVSFVLGAVVLREKNLRAKALDLLLLVVGMIFLYLGSNDL